MASSRGPRRGRAATMVRSTPAGRQPASARRVDDRREHVGAVDAGGRGRTGREDPTQVAQPGRPEQTIGHGMEGHVAIASGRPGAGHRRTRGRRGAGLAGTEAVAVVTDPGPPTDSGAIGRERGGDPGEVRGHGHLEIDGIAGNDMDRNATGLEQGGLVGPRASVRGR